MTIENKIRMLAGSMVLISLLGYLFVTPWFLLLAAFVGLNLFQSSITGICPAEKIFRKLSSKEPAGQANTAQ